MHTPHIGGVLHAYRRQGERLTRRALADDVSTHQIGSRELDLAVWLGGWLVLPAQDGRRLRVFDAAKAAGAWAEQATLALPGRVVMTTAAIGAASFGVLLDDGRALVVAGTARAP